MGEKKTIKFTKRSFISSLSGLAYEMAPGFKPRNFDKIIDYVKENFEQFEGFKDWEVKFNGKVWELKNACKNFLMQCQEFRQLNISQKRYDLGQREPDSGFAVVAVGHDSNGVPCSIMTPEEYCDFIDLDAFCSNLAGALSFDSEASETSCFLCKFAKSYGSLEPSGCDTCEHCLNNPKNEDYWYKYETHPLAEKNPSEMTEEELKITGKLG